MHDTTIGWRFVNPRMEERLGTDSMPETAENVASEFAVCRRTGRVRPALAGTGRQGAGRGGWPGRSAGPGRSGGRPGFVETTSTRGHLVGARRVRPLFPGGSVTAGNSSGINDGAAALLVASDVRGATGWPLARITLAAAGVPPRIMGIGPVPATQKLLARAGLTSTIELVELNEAFASQS